MYWYSTCLFMLDIHQDFLHVLSKSLLVHKQNWINYTMIFHLQQICTYYNLQFWFFFFPPRLISRKDHIYRQILFCSSQVLSQWYKTKRKSHAERVCQQSCLFPSPISEMIALQKITNGKSEATAKKCNCV